MLGWWCRGRAGATCGGRCRWLLLARYGVSFLPYTESAAVTTSVTSLSDILRGTENWVSYLVVDGQPWWPPGYRIATGGRCRPCSPGCWPPRPGRAGCGRGCPARRFLLCLLLAGVVDHRRPGT